MKLEELQFELNARKVSVRVKPDATLLDVLREDLDLTGAKRGCGEGECGACTVLIDGMPVDSCIYPALKAAGKNIETIEGLGTEDNLHPVQKAFLDEGAVQCGFCTPGMILSTRALLAKNQSPSEEEVKVALSGNLCRCTGYTKIINAVKVATRNINKL
ncbi:MAG TPA: (2Fe-2S)-binding protein [Desulfotomaculum sp.]|nr:MAG: hypothetical protein JL56_14490 [Desulfotomaculum sp. BICA1-6]HBX24215.1 (2Fe-2S)-binding protein [Desulfotomaculum sp.]